ncbi:MAG: hypothetical protein AAGD32_17125 [Planctomycetota bacterium]
MRSLRTQQFATTIIAAGVALACIAGCEEELPTPNQPTSPTAQTPTNDPVTVVPDEPEAFPAMVIIEEQTVEFPPAVLVLREDGDVTTAVLYTDDPKEMLDDDYRGNSFYFEMELPDVTIEQIMTGGDAPNGQRQVTPFAYIIEESRRTGTPNGLFLNGGEFVLQPKDADFILDPNGTGLSVEVSGMFARFAGDEAFSGERVVVRATLIPEVVPE